MHEEDADEPLASHEPPEVKVGYAPAGRATLSAIEDELGAPMRGPEAPVIEIGEAPAGRETLAAIAEELAESMRPRQHTLPYADRISNAPGAVAPRSRAPISVPAPDRTPMPALRNAAPLDSTPKAGAAAGALEIFELLTFIVRGGSAADLSSDALRRRFVERHLLQRLPGGSLDAVERIEVTPWTAHGTMVVRIWCKS